MQLHRKKRKYGCPINITPLIDVVFLLIIFSMVVSQFTKVEVEALEVPEAQEGQPPTEAAIARITVNVHGNGRIVVAGGEHTLGSLQALLSEAAKAQGDNVSVLIRGDRDTPWQAVRDIMKLCASIGINRVKIAVIRPQE